MRTLRRKGLVLFTVVAMLFATACGSNTDEPKKDGTVTGDQTPAGDNKQTTEPGGDTQSGDSQGEAGNNTETPGTADNQGSENPGTTETPADNTQGKATVIVLSDSGITVEGSGCKVKENRVKIEEPGTYEISGTLSNGYIYVNVDNESEVHVILKGVTVHNETSAAFYAKKASKVTVTLAAGTENVFSDGPEYVFEPEEDEPDATFFAKHDLVIEGEGTLKVTANYGDAIKGKDSLYIQGGIIEVNSVDEGIVGRDLLHITGGKITVNAEGDAIKSTNDVDATLGNIIIDGGELTLTGESDDIQAENMVIINGGTLHLSAGKSGIQSEYGTEYNGGTVSSLQ